MPRLPKTAADKQHIAIVHAIDTYTADCKRNGIDRQQVADRLGLDYQTLLLRKKNPEKFKLYELQHIANVMNISLGTLLGLDK